jgi:hypothetical protein
LRNKGPPGRKTGSPLSARSPRLERLPGRKSDCHRRLHACRASTLEKAATPMPIIAARASNVAAIGLSDRRLCEVTGFGFGLPMGCMVMTHTPKRWAALSQDRSRAALAQSEGNTDRACWGCGVSRGFLRATTYVRRRSSRAHEKKPRSQKGSGLFDNLG